MLLCLPFLSFSQDPSFSQFYANRIYLNPAFAGMEPGIGVSGVARMQWAAVDRGFRTYGFSADAQLPVARLGVGLHLLRDTEGIGNLTINQAGLVNVTGVFLTLLLGWSGRRMDLCSAREVKTYLMISTAALFNQLTRLIMVSVSVNQLIVVFAIMVSMASSGLIRIPGKRQAMMILKSRVLSPWSIFSAISSIENYNDQNIASR